jgi:NAD(P)H dehydrogenase (quinone)
MILVSGANGPFGRLITEHLLTRVPAGELAVSVRDPAAAKTLTHQGVRVRHGDFDRPETLVDAFAGADTVFVNGTNYGATPAARARQQEAALRAAEAAGATRIVVTSWPDLENCPLDMAGGFSATERLVAAAGFPDTERLVAATGPAYTILRLAYGLAPALARDVRTALATGVLAAPAGDARATPAAIPDLAEASANVLVEAGHAGRTYELTGPDAIAWADLATLASALAGTEVRYETVSDAEFRDQSLAGGFPAAAIDSLLALYAAFRSGWASRPARDLAHLLHRAPIGSLDAVRHVLKG